MQRLKAMQQASGENRGKERRPSVLVLSPSRELGEQILSTVKTLSHEIKLSSTSLMGGKLRKLQKKRLAQGPVDIVVASPARLLEFWRDELLFLGGVKTVVLDEADLGMDNEDWRNETMSVIEPLLHPGRAEKRPQLVFATASVTKNLRFCLFGGSHSLLSFCVRFLGNS